PHAFLERDLDPLLHARAIVRAGLLDQRVEPHRFALGHALRETKSLAEVVTMHERHGHGLDDPDPTRGGYRAHELRVAARIHRSADERYGYPGLSCERRVGEAPGSRLPTPGCTSAPRLPF